MLVFIYIFLLVYQLNIMTETAPSLGYFDGNDFCVVPKSFFVK